MKATIKKLSEAVNNVLDANETSNEMAALIDFGEWSQTGPDFTRLIENWKLTREILIGYITEAEQYSKRFFECYPAPKQWKYYGDSVEYRNPWWIITSNLHCLFMAGYLQPDNEE